MNELIDDLIDATYNSGYYAGRLIECDDYTRKKYTELSALEIEKRKALRRKLIDSIERKLYENNPESF